MDKISLSKLLERPLLLKLISAGLLIAAIGLTLLQLSAFKESQKYFPSGSMIAEIPVGGLDRKEAGDLLFETFNQPVELQYQGHRLQISPIALGFKMDIEAMLSEAEQLSQTSFGAAFWNYLWNINAPSAVVSVPPVCRN